MSHIVIVKTGTSCRVYINTVDETSTAASHATLGVNNYTVHLGADWDSSYFNGIIDEVRVSTTNRSTDWLATEYANQNSPADFFSSIGSTSTLPVIGAGTSAASTLASGGGGSIIVTNLSIGSPSDSAATTLNNDVNDRALDIENLTITTNGIFESSSSNNLTISNDFTNNNTFEANGGTVIFDDNTEISTISAPSATNFYGFSVLSANKEINFDHLHPVGIGGSLIVNGQSCDSQIKLYSDLQTNEAEIDVASGSTVDIQYADIRDLNATGIGLTATNSYNSGNNTHWTIQACGGGANTAPDAPSSLYSNNTDARSGQSSPVTGLTDHTPAFSAVYTDTDTSDTAAYYQLQVGTDNDWGTAETWDSAKTSMDACNHNSRCNDVIYVGSTGLSDGSTYYWRLRFWDNSDAASDWSSTAQFSINSPPSVVSILLNNSLDIDLSAGSTTPVNIGATIRDTDGSSHLTGIGASAVAVAYRSGVALAQLCLPDDNNCYASVCTISACSGNDCQANCPVNLEFFADPTSDTSSYASQYWRAYILVNDTKLETGNGFSATDTPDVNTLSAIDIGSTLTYGEILPGDYSPSNVNTPVTNIGNVSIDMELSGTNLDAGVGTTIASNFQQYSLSTFTYGVGETLISSLRYININLAKPTISPSDSTKSIYWGIGIPLQIIEGNYQGDIEAWQTPDQ